MLSSQTIYSSLAALMVAIFSLLAVTLTPDVASADEPPLRLSFINSAAKGGEKAHETINRFLEASDDIAVTDAKKVWKEAEELGLLEKDFRSSALREKNADYFRDLMKALDIEGLMILDVFSRGRTAQIVVIGPSGREIADVREDVRRGRVSKSQAKDMLKRSFKELVPAVRDFRAAGGWAAQEEEKEEEVDEDLDLLSGVDDEEPGADDGGELSIKDQLIADKSGDAAAIDDRFRLDVGALIGQRSLSMTGDDGLFELGHESPFVGFGGRLDGVIANFGSSALGFGIFGGYAPFTTIFRGETEYASAFARIGAELLFLQPLSDRLSLDIFAGAEATSVTIEQNADYTGNRYVSARAGVGFDFDADPVVLHIGGGVLPVFMTDNSDAAYGTTDFNLGYEGNAGLDFAITDALTASASYTFHFYAPQYREPIRPIGGPISSSDMMHLGLVSLGYAL